MEKTTTLKEGAVLRGTDYVYHIERVLGQGILGITYLATTTVSIQGKRGNVEMEIKVAIKEFYMHEFCSRHEDGTIAEMTQGMLVANYARKFRNEAENLAKLSHPNIVKVLEVFDANNTTYYAMEYISGGSLDDYVRQQGGLSETEAIACIRQIGSALSYMHDHKMLHLDLKPSNVMRSSDGSKLKLIDFGLLEQYEDNGYPEAGVVILPGTPGYAPIEQSTSGRDRDFAPTLDVYALGATFFKLLTGQTPPQASTVLDEGLPISVLQQKGISRQSIDALKQAMEPRKLKRLKTVDSFLSALGITSDDGGMEIDPLEKLKPEKPLQPKKPQPKKPSPKPSFPKWLYGVAAAIVAAVVVFLAIGKGNKYVAVESINVTLSELSMKEGESKKLSVEFTPGNATDKSIVWFSSDDNVAKVDNATGDVTALKAGKATITAACGGKTVYCNVTVTAKRVQQSAQSAHSGASSSSYVFTVNGVSFKMVSVQGGTFQMGATSEQGSEAESDESPVHSVTLSSYKIGETEVTQALWQALMGSNPSYSKGDNLPVVKVSWDDCQTFIRKLNSLTGQNFRLPTEAEWEYAARGGNRSNHTKYSGSSSMDNVAWYKDNSGSKTHAVKGKQPNELGLYDMSGNVWEWCQDWYGSYSSSSQTNPTGPASGSNRVRRGGSWRSDARYCLVSIRYGHSPDSSGNDLGLRLAL